jgi:hypothetical protein
MQFASADEARVWLSLLISQRPTNKIEDEAQVPSANSRPESDADKAFSYSSQALELRVLEVKNVLEDLLMRSSGGMDASYCSSKASELAEEWLSGVIRESQGEEDELLGSLWLEGRPAKTEHGTQILSDLEWQVDGLTAEGVTDRDIQRWWDLPVWQRHLNMVENSALFDSRVRVKYQEYVKQSGEKPNRVIEMIARKQAACTVPRFAFAIYSSGELPWELYPRAYKFLLKELRENPKFELEAIEAGSFNELFRSKVL